MPLRPQPNGPPPAPEVVAGEQEYKLLFDRNPQPMLVYAVTTRQIMAANDAAVASYGYTREEFLAMSIDDLTPGEDAAMVQAYLRSLPPEGRRGPSFARPWRHQRHDGVVIDIEITSDEVLLAGERCRLCLCQDVTERNKVTAQLAITRDAAVEASNLKSAFLANMSHEIRTPMSGVIGMNELLLGTELTQEQRFYAEQVTASGEQLLAIINDVLDVAKIEAGRLELDVVEFDLRATVDQACAVASVRLHEDGLRLDLNIDPRVPVRARGDGGRLRQILLNLVANAVKFTAEGAVTVTVTARAHEAGHMLVRFEVHDTGIGIDAAQLDDMFEPFTQADASTARNYGGTGLGLAIARELVELMGGTMGAQSEPGQGSTFWFEVALGVVAGAAPPAPGDESGAPAAAARGDDAPIVLVAEDSPVNQVVAVRTLERCGYRADVACDGQEALAALAARRYDAILMDCQMPVMDGYEATAEVRRRSHGGAPRTPVIAMTAHAMAGDRERCLAAGMDDYISKPMRAHTLDEVLQRWIPGAPSLAVAEPTAPARDGAAVA